MFVSNNFGITQLYKVFRSFTVHWKKMVQNVNTSFLFPFFFKRHTFNFNNGENTMLTFCALGSLIRITNIETTAFIVSFQDQSHGAIEWTLCGTCPTDEKNGRANAGHTWKKIVSTCIPAGKKQNHIIPIIPCHPPPLFVARLGLDPPGRHRHKGGASEHRAAVEQPCEAIGA